MEKNIRSRNRTIKAKYHAKIKWPLKYGVCKKFIQIGFKGWIICFRYGKNYTNFAQSTKNKWDILTYVEGIKNKVLKPDMK